MTKTQARTTVAILVVLVGPGFCSRQSLSAAEPTHALPAFRGEVEPGRTTIVDVPPPTETRVRSIVIAIRQPGRMKPAESLACRVDSSGPRWRCLLRKALDLGDLDMAGIVQQATDEPLRITVAWSGPGAHGQPAGALPIAVRVTDLGPVARPKAADAVRPLSEEHVDFETEPNDSPELGQPPGPGQDGLRPGRRPALLDARTRIPMARSTRRGSTGSGSGSTDQIPGSRFSPSTSSTATSRPTCGFTSSKDGRIVEYTRGIDPQSLQRERPPRPGANKFTTRVLAPGHLLRPG